MSDNKCEMTYEMTDVCGGEETITAESDKDAIAQTKEWLSGGEYDTTEGTVYVHGHVRRADLPDDIDGVSSIPVSVVIHPDEPDCTGRDGHAWVSPVEVVHGCKENPGVYGHGGGVIITEVCRYCGAYRVTDTWAQDEYTGEQGLRSVAYRPADDVSEAWVARQTADARAWVAEHDDDDVVDEDELAEIFVTLIGREPDDDDRANGLWSLVCAEVGDEGADE